jgi:hypothetical protein
MAEWFIDHLATGTGSGDTPADAATNVQSFFFAANTASLAFGDKIWVRRTHVSSVMSLAAALGRPSWSANSLNPLGWIIGWPKTGEMFFDARPSSAISAGWDSDVNSAYPDINKPTISYSGTGLGNFSPAEG